MAHYRKLIAGAVAINTAIVVIEAGAAFLSRFRASAESG